MSEFLSITKLFVRGQRDVRVFAGTARGFGANCCYNPRCVPGVWNHRKKKTCVRFFKHLTHAQTLPKQNGATLRAKTWYFKPQYLLHKKKNVFVFGVVTFFFKYYCEMAYLLALSITRKAIYSNYFTILCLNNNPYRNKYDDTWKIFFFK